MGVNLNLVGKKTYKMANCKSKKGNKFTLKDYRENEDINYHTENALALIEKFGTKSELKEMVKIQNMHKSEGHINSKNYERRYKLSQKYFKCLFMK